MVVAKNRMSKFIKVRQELYRMGICYRLQSGKTAWPDGYRHWPIANRDFCSWLFLASASRLPVRVYSKIECRVLVTQAGG